MLPCNQSAMVRQVGVLSWWKDKLSPAHSLLVSSIVHRVAHPDPYTQISVLYAQQESFYIVTRYIKWVKKTSIGHTQYFSIKPEPIGRIPLTARYKYFDMSNFQRNLKFLHVLSFP